jgi:hypothetical protein
MNLRWEKTKSQQWKPQVNSENPYGKIPSIENHLFSKQYPVNYF